MMRNKRLEQNDNTCVVVQSVVVLRLVFETTK